MQPRLLVDLDRRHGHRRELTRRRALTDARRRRVPRVPRWRPNGHHLERDGHARVLAGNAVRPAELVVLASWRGKGAIPF
ncbi:MAG: hypothetical protein ACJ76Z_10325 [Thermoleophilaceae bacterium]